MLGEFFRAKRPCAGLGGDAAHFRLVAMGVLHYTKPSCGVSPACRTPVSCNSPPTGDGAAAVCGGVVPKPQNTSVKNTENRPLVARWSVFWAQRCLSWCVGCT